MNLKRLIICTVFAALDCLTRVEALAWSYHDPNGPSTWAQHHPTCDGLHQSPINIKHEETIYDASLSDISIHLEANVSAELRNNGETVKVSFSSEKSTIKAGGLTSTFRSFELHFHWGNVSSRGSEHQFEGKSFPMEIHTLYFNAEKYENASEAMTKKDGLVATSVLAEVQVIDNPAVEVVVEHLGNLSYKGSTTRIRSFPLASFLPHDTSHFYRYHGSKTTPECHENVEWFVFENKVRISQRQIDRFRGVFEVRRLSTKKVNLVDNFRPVQPLNGRSVRRSFDSPPIPCGKTANYTAVCSKLAGDKVVYYNVTVNPCVLPVTVSLNVNVPDLDFNFVKILVTDSDTYQIGSLDYGVKMEMHSYTAGPFAGNLHVSLYQVYPLSDNPQTSEVVNAYFKTDGVCNKATCTPVSWNKHWCKMTAIGYGNDTLHIAYHLTVKSVCDSTPSVSVKFYRNDSSDHWILSDVLSFTDGKNETVDLTRHVVCDSLGVTARLRRGMESSWLTHMPFRAKIRKSNNKVDFSLRLTPFGCSYLVLDDVFTYDVSICNGKTGGLGQGGKIAVGVVVVLVVVLLIGLTVGILYHKRKRYFGHRPALVEELEVQDDINL